MALRFDQIELAGTNSSEKPVLQASGDSVQVSTAYGYIDIGPKNTSYSHFYTDRDKYFFDKRIMVNEGIISSFDEDLHLKVNNDANTVMTLSKTSPYNVGIGTTTPDASLTIKTGSSAGLAKISSDANGAVYSANGDVQFYTNNSAYAINFFSANKVSNLMCITDGGNVGIGTTSLASKLEVNGDIRLKNSGRLYLWKDNSSNYIDYNNWITSTGATQTIQNTGSGGITFKTSTSARMFISGAGDVGIGTTSPSEKLDVFSSAIIGSQSTNSSTTNFENKLIVKGKNNYADGTTWYGDYGQIVLRANQNFTSSARRFLITNALDNRKFAIVRSVDADTDPIVNSTATGVNSGTADFVIDNTGNVGIGTTGPSQKVVISGPNTAPSLNTTAVSSASLLVSNSDTGYGTYFGSTSAGVGLIQQRRQTSAVYYDLSLQPYGGNVGVGTTAPAYELDVRSSAADASIYVKDGATGGPIRLRSSGSGEAFIYIGNESSSISRAGGDLNFNANSIDMTFSTNNGSTKHMFISTAGNVGIGTTSPGYKLDVLKVGSDAINIGAGNDFSGIRFTSDAHTYSWRVGGDNLFIYDVTNAAQRFTIDSSGSIIVNNAGSGNGIIKINGATGSTEALIFQRGGAEASRIGHSNSADLTFSTGSGVSERMRITSGGNVGIGTTSPDGLLNLKHTSSSSSVANDATAYALTLNFEGVTGDYGRHIAIRDASGQAVAAIGGYDEGTGGATGLFFATGNATTAAQEAMMIDSSGNVGIGTTTPSYPLEVQSGGVGTVLRAGTSFISIDPAGSAAAPSLVFNGDSNTGIWRPAADTLGFSTAGSEAMRITSGGNVGIGTTSPINGGSTARWLTINGDIGSSYSGGVVYSINGSVKAYHYVQGDNIIHQGQSGVGHRFLADGSEKMRIASGGNVGIGTTSPTEKLDIEGSGSTNLEINNTLNSISLTLGAQSTAARLTAGTGNRLGFGANNTADQVTISTSGNVGIGTTTPGSELEVDGEITTTTITYPEPGALDSSAYNGEIVYFGAFEPVTIAEGTLMSLGNDGGGNMRWYKAVDNVQTKATGLLGITLGTSISAGLLVRGIAKNSTWSSFAAGDKLYLSPTSGAISNSITSDTNDFVRIVGYALGSSKIYFCPDNTYIQNA